MPALSITPPPPAPTRDDPDPVFVAKANAWLAWQERAAGEFSAVSAAVQLQFEGAIAARAAAEAAAESAANAPGSSTTSVSSVTLGTGDKVFIGADADSLFYKGQMLVAASADDPTKQLSGFLRTNVGGVLTINVPSTDYISGAGTFDDWVISLGVKRSNVVPGAGPADTWGRTSVAVSLTPGGEAAADIFQPVANTSTITLDLNAGRRFVVSPTLSGAHIMANPTNSAVGKGGIIKAKQPVGGGATMAFGSWWKRQGGAAALSTAANSEDWILYEVVEAGQILYAIIKAPT